VPLVTWKNELPGTSVTFNAVGGGPVVSCGADTMADGPTVTTQEHAPDVPYDWLPVQIPEAVVWRLWRELRLVLKLGWYKAASHPPPFGGLPVETHVMMNEMGTTNHAFDATFAINTAVSADCTGNGLPGGPKESA
jgi:hypothetical protein